MTHKFGIKVPTTVEEALTLDKENGNDLWWKAIQKEMSEVKVAFKILDDDDKPPIGSQYMKCHLVFSIEMEDFSRKACLVAGGHIVVAPKSLTFASVVSKESVRIVLTLAVLNNLEVKTSDIQNAYLTVPCSEKVHTTLGTEFGDNKGKPAVIVRALYGLASSGASVRNHLADCMHHLGYESCLEDPDLWFKNEVRKEDNYKYYFVTTHMYYSMLMIVFVSTTQLRKNSTRLTSFSR